MVQILLLPRRDPELLCKLGLLVDHRDDPPVGAPEWYHGFLPPTFYLTFFKLTLTFTFNIVENEMLSSLA